MLRKDKVKPFASTPQTLLAWCSEVSNKISVVDLETKQNYATFDGARVSFEPDPNVYNWMNGWTHVKGIPNTKLLVSLHHSLHYEFQNCAKMEIFDISKKMRAKKIYSFGDVFGATSWGDVTYNSRRSILGAIPVTGTIAYHLFAVDSYASNAADAVKLSRKSKWPSKYTSGILISDPVLGDEILDNFISGFDFNPTGESIGVINRDGVCLISDVNTNNHHLHVRVGSQAFEHGCCRWSTNADEPLLFVTFDNNKLNILDVEKKTLTLTNPIQIEEFIDKWGGPITFSIDVCQSNGNLLAAVGASDGSIKIFDKRKSRIVNTFKDIHSYYIFCVRWSPNGDMLASASGDNTAKLLDFKTGKIIYTGQTADSRHTTSVCFI